MQKVTNEILEELKNNSIDCWRFPFGNFWIYHYKKDNLFYPIKHFRSNYYLGEPTPYFSECISASVSRDGKLETNPSNCEMFSRTTRSSIEKFFDVQ